MNATCTYAKQEKLKGRKQIETLFKSGKHLYKYPIKVFYRIYENKGKSFPLQAGVGVSKRYFTKAVKRNCVKRLLREAFRLHKSRLLPVLNHRNICLDLFFLYTAKEVFSMDEAEQKMIAAIEALTEKINQAP